MIRSLFLSLLILLAAIWVLVARPIISPEKVLIETRVNEKLLYQHVKMLSVDLSPRDYSHIENLNAVAEYIKDQFEKIDLEVKEQKFKVDNQEYKNILTSFGPEKSSKIVIGAHYDAAGLFPGADDNASGVAGLIELARLLKDETLTKNITLVAYTLEEPPYFATGDMGSYVHAEKEREANQDIELMISLEMIGYFSDEKNSQKFPSKILNIFYPDQGNFIVIVDQLLSGWARRIKKEMTKNMTLPVYSINAPAMIPGIDFSDHRNYWAHGYPAVMITDTSFYRNLAYHTEEDTIERLDFKKMAQVVKGIFGYVKSL